MHACTATVLDHRANSTPPRSGVPTLRGPIASGPVTDVSRLGLIYAAEELRAVTRANLTERLRRIRLGGHGRHGAGLS